jgi:hypothetical protein
VSVANKCIFRVNPASHERIFAYISKIQRAFCVFDRHGLNRVGIDHCSSEIAVPEQLLNCTNIIIGLEQMAGKTVAEGMGGNSLWNFCLLHRN